MSDPSDVAKEAIKGLSGAPILLLVALLNVMMLGALVYVAKAQVEERKVIADGRDDMIKSVLAQCGPKG
jgi:hypothetical protein